jgi:hypothetical protein
MSETATTPARRVVDLEGVRRFYLDASAWNLLADHPEREKVLRFIGAPGKRCAVPSLVNAAELLRTKNAERRRILCETMAATVTDGRALLPHPMDVLEDAARDFQKGEDAVTLGENGDTRTLRALIADPSRLDAERMEDLDRWAAGEKAALVDFWKYVTDVGVRDPSLRIGVDFLGPSAPVSMLGSYTVARKLALGETELRSLVEKVPPWSAFFLTLGLSFDMVNQTPFSKGKAAELPNGPDFLQLTYLGLVNDFVVDDAGLLEVAQRASEMLVRTRGATVRARSASDFFISTGYEHPARPKRFATA